jgi:hypothetical protein
VRSRGVWRDFGIILFHFGQDREKAEYISFLLAASKKCGFFAAPNINENMENI